MAIPDYQTLMLPLLKELSSGEEKSGQELNQQLIDDFGLTKEEQNELLPSGNQEVIKNRLGWARTYLKKAQLIESPRRSVFKITQRGQDVLAEAPERIDARYLRRFDEFLEFQNTSNQQEDTNETESNASVKTPTEQIELAYSRLNNELADELLACVKEAEPKFFEQLVVDLMLAMGYGGSRKEAGRATQYTSDGGIDGVINEDPLGLDTIYLQAKRYKDACVGRPEVQSFAGALDMRRAKKGVFITTSKFSRDAHDYVGMIEKKIVLIDGEYLADLMIKHNLGVSIKETYQVKAIDSDYFNED